MAGSTTVPDVVIAAARRTAGGTRRAGARRSAARPPALGRSVAVLVGAATVGVVGVAAANGNPVATQPYVPGDAPPPPSEDLTVRGRPVAAAADDTPEWLRWVLDGFVWLCAAAIVVMLVVLVLRLFVGRNTGIIHRRVMEPEEVAALAAPSTDIDLLGRGRDLSAAAEAGIAALATGTDVRAGIIAAWLAMEEAAGAAGTPRREDDAPADLVARVLAAHDVRPRRLQVLADLYRQARFSPSPLTEDDRVEAQRALADVRDDLVRPPAGDRKAPRWT